MAEPVIYEEAGRMARITLNTPDKRNALSAEMVKAISKALGQAAASSEAKVIIITGNGPAFCAGADLLALSKMQSEGYATNLADSLALRDLFLQMYSLPKVIIARINGHAIAGGCGLAALADFSFAISEAKLGYTEVKIGFIPALVSAFLVRKIGEGKARELLLSGELISAEKAVQYGLINRVLDNSEQLDTEIIKLAETLIYSNSLQAMAQTKVLLASMSGAGLFENLNLAAEANASARTTPDCIKGVNAFLNRERLVW